DQLNAMDGVVCDLPKGAFYAYPDVSAFFGRKGSNGPIEDGSDLCEYLLDEARVACVPGVAFGTKPHLRLSYATSMENLQMALERMADAFGRLS
ncbi:MAG: aminotransferase class I/II-fold pyridoxal phosphate-dependent enzyme, partial [Gemmatimonadetes bacterium]|nr:aminotransferase class I/II-fold pyridoxal phosphate-dependent enzyme [Gemmatimonadota bacterium]